MTLLPEGVAEACIKALDGIKILRVETLSGGDSNQARLLKTDDGDFFLKMNNEVYAESLLEKESQGLKQLGKHIRTPRVLGMGCAEGWGFLLLEYINEGKRSSDFWRRFGEGLAGIHSCKGTSFGLDYNNYIGLLKQSNQPADSWAEFYAAQRLEPQIARAVDKGLLWDNVQDELEQLYKNIHNICPDEPPALIHGDLWGGNFLTTSNSHPALIDPAICFAHREMDLAMTRLFGGFSHLFYESYEHHYPTAPGLKERIGIYQLYYLLVHVNLFGRSYTEAAKSIVQRYI